MKKSTKVLIAAAVLIILIAGGFFAWQKGLIKITMDKPTDIHQDSIQDWKTYISQYGFEFKYPQGFFVEDPEAAKPIHCAFVQCSSNNTIGFAPQGGQRLEKIIVNDNPVCIETDVDSGMGSISKNDYFIFSNAGICFYVHASESYLSCSAYYDLPEKQTEYQNCMKEKEDREAIFKDIISTFKIIKPDALTEAIIRELDKGGDELDKERIIDDMYQIRSFGTQFYDSYGVGYGGMNCTTHPEITDICNNSKSSGREIVINSTKDAYCAYVKLAEGDYLCVNNIIDNKPTRTSVYPGGTGYCSGLTYNCPR